MRIHPSSRPLPSPFRRPAFRRAFLLAAALLPGGLRAEDSPPPSAYECDIRPLIENFCGDCHSGPKKKGGIDLGRFETTDEVKGAMEIWRRAAVRLESKEMPPETSPQPGDEARARIVAWIKSLEGENPCGTIASDQSSGWYRGYVMSRRLNRREYENTVRDIFGEAIRLADLFPADGAGGEGFDNHGDALFTSSLLVEKYMEASSRIVERFIPPRGYEAWPQPARGIARVAAMRAVRREGVAQPDQWLASLADGRAGSPALAALPVFESLIPIAFRRPADPGEAVRYASLAGSAAQSSGVFEDGLRAGVRAVLMSPHFLFLPEPEPASQGVYELDGWRLASRLSYFLWGSMPDDELFLSAREGKLTSDDELRAQVRRMMRDPKTRGMAESFASQWLEIEALGGAVKPDPARFPEFTPDLAASMREEAIRFFEFVIREDRSLLDLIDADYTFADNRLARIYGLPEAEGDGMRLVKWDDRNRGGVLGLAAVLTATSQPLRTSPVLRGKWVLEQVLGERVPPPPPDVPSLPADDHAPDGLTFRERLAKHRENPECASCHQRMDPIGLGLENFDPVGRWRSEQGGTAVDASGTLPSGESFNGPAELKAIILGRKEAFARHFARKMLGYALGRTLTKFDDCVIDDAVKALAANDYRSSALLETIVLSQPFRRRYGGGA